MKEQTNNRLSIRDEGIWNVRLLFTRMKTEKKGATFIPMNCVSGASSPCRTLQIELYLELQSHWHTCVHILPYSPFPLLNLYYKNYMQWA